MSLKEQEMTDIIEKINQPVVINKRYIKRKVIDKVDKTYCCVPQCGTYGFRCPDASFHCFPSEKNDLLRRKKWILALRMGKPITPSMRVCSKHFRTCDFINPEVSTWRPCLRKDCVPSLNLPVDNPQPKKPSKKIALPKRKEIQEPEEKPVYIIKLKPATDTEDNVEVKQDSMQYEDDNDDSYALRIDTSDEDSCNELFESKRTKFT